MINTTESTLVLSVHKLFFQKIILWKTNRHDYKLFKFCTFLQNNGHCYHFGYTNHQRVFCIQIGKNKKIGYSSIWVHKSQACFVYQIGYTRHRLLLWIIWMRSREKNVFSIKSIGWNNKKFFFNFSREELSEKLTWEHKEIREHRFRNYLSKIPYLMRNFNH